MNRDAEGSTRVSDSPARHPAPRTSDEAIAAYTRRMRPLRIGYAMAIAVAVLIALVVVKIAYDRGEISHVQLHTVAAAPPSITNSPVPAAQPAKVWSSRDATAIGTPVDGGTVVTHDAHTVRGRNALTGAQTWSYTRTDRIVCTAIQTESVTIAVYRLHGDCDELTALATGTGRRRWTRTLDKDGAVFDGPASYSVDGSDVLFVSKTSLYAISVGGSSDLGNGGLDYWTFYHPACTINGAVLGNGGALISQTCHGEKCQQRKFCGDGTQLLLRDWEAKYDEDSTTNPDQVKWNDIGSDLVPTSAGATITARDPNGATLTSFDAKTGKPGARLPLSGASGAGVGSAVTSGTDADLIWIGRHTYALRPGSTSFVWRADTTGVPTTQSGTVLDGTAPLAPTTSGAVTLDPGKGTVTTHYPIAPPPVGSTVTPLGSGILVAGSQTVVYR